MKTNLYQVGVTESGIKVFGGVFNFYSERGLPLDVIFASAIEQNWIPSWIHFYNEAKDAGMKHDRILAKLEEALCDTFGVDYSNKVISKLNNIVGKNA